MISINYQEAMTAALEALGEADDQEQVRVRSHPEATAGIQRDIANALTRAQVYATLALAAANVP